VDRKRPARHRLRTLALLLVATPALAASAPLPLAALRWTEPTLALDALTSGPPECPAAIADAADRARIEVGRAAFRTPLLLGGQAARLGLSCDSCHVNGRGNSAFRFPGLSGAPGTADVTAPLMSTHRGDESFDPRPIPDLARPGKISRAPGDPALRRFIRGLIVEEFDGREPPPAVLDGLASYVRALDSKACPLRRALPASAESTADSALRAVAAARERLGAGDRAGARLMLGAARGALGRLAERYVGLTESQRRLIAADAHLLSVLTRLDRPGADRAMQSWLDGAHAWRTVIARDEPRSLFAREALARALTSATARRSTR